jgi:hypothetical protein
MINAFLPLGWKVSGLHVKSVRMQGPIMDPVQIAKFLLRDLCGLPLIRGIKFHSTLADLTYPACVAEHIFEELGDKSWHAYTPTSCTTL